jgi:hypothetical protein
VQQLFSPTEGTDPLSFDLVKVDILHIEGIGKIKI